MPRRVLYAMSVVALLAAACGEAAEDEAADFPEQDVTFVVPYSAGGGYDTLARGLAPFLEEHLGGDADVVVDNRPGAAGQTGTSYVYGAPADGYTIYLSNIPGLMGGQVIVDDPGYDLEEFTWLGRATLVDNGLAVAADSEYESVEDLQAEDELLFAGADLGDAVTAIMAFEDMGLSVRYLPHDGSGEAVTSVLRGDADITYFSTSSILPHVESGDLRVLVQFADEPLEGLDAPLAEDAGYGELADIAVQHRAIGAPPGLPDDVAATLERALEDAVNDPEYQEWAESVEQPAAWLSAEETAQIVERSTQLIDDARDSLRSNLGVE